MKTRRILLLSVCGLCLVGCKSNKYNQELLERELRCQENRIYELENALDQCESELEWSRRDSHSSGGSSSNSGGGGRRPGGLGLPIIDMPSDSGRRPARVPGDADEPSMPVVEPGEEIAPPAAGSGASTAPEPGDRQIARIVLNKQMTGGSSQVEGGNGGIVVVFEPRNARGEMVAEPGDVSIALVDPQRGGPEARLARWDFAAINAFQQFRRSGSSGRGFAFELPWPEEAPQNKNLQLFVRYVTPDGRKLVTQMPVNIEAPKMAGRWRMATPSADRTASDDAPKAGRGRRLLARSAPDRPVRDSEAPRFEGGSDAGANETASLPRIERDSSDADEDDDPPVSRRSSSDRQASRPAWSPFR